LGLQKGQSIDWPMPNGQKERLKVLDVLFQPEAAGLYHI
jgi:regulator of nucleoside diphosphate kinase